MIEDGTRRVWVSARMMKPDLAGRCRGMRVSQAGIVADKDVEHSELAGMAGVVGALESRLQPAGRSDTPGSGDLRSRPEPPGPGRVTRPRRETRGHQACSPAVSRPNNRPTRDEWLAGP
jgi:hypothetical protein